MQIFGRYLRGTRTRTTVTSIYTDIFVLFSVTTVMQNMVPIGLVVSTENICQEITLKKGQ